ncbi:MAG: type II/IV secretion system protein [Candidatus Yanofskybacteria bacterium]|nr:type II/IV secretion system protein [Candidatus Yanofskybacteria bacterium]
MPPQSPAQKREEELEKKLAEIKVKENIEEYSARAKKFGLPFSTLKGVPIDTEALNLLDEEEARQSNVAVLYKNEGKLIVALLDPENATTRKTVDSLKLKGYALDLLITTPDILRSVLERYKVIKQKVFKVGAIEIDETELAQLQDQIKNIGDLQNKLASISVTKLLEILIAGALKTEASDIHFEPETDDARLRYRLDGILHDITKLEVAYYEKILNRVKVLSKMKLNIHDAPQDGRFTIKQKNVDIEVRVSILPSEFGETVVMRLLDPRTIKSTLEELGMRKDLMDSIKKELTKKTGAIMTSGPTGAGKTTTLYAFVNHLNEPGNKIITIEDPIEYHVKNISQTQVDPKRGYTFANGLRSIVRQDPNIILVGEIRDAETAEIALHASLTGHLVLSTIHTNDAAGVVPRLVDLGIRPQIIAPAINVTIAQRLVRKLCPNCKQKIKASPEVLQKIKTALEPIKNKIDARFFEQDLDIYQPNKCDQCNFSGYRGRVGVFEAFIVSKNIEELILTSPSMSSIKTMAINEGMITMMQDAYLKLIDGITSVEELERVLS